MLSRICKCSVNSTRKNEKCYAVKLARLKEGSIPVNFDQAMLCKKAAEYEHIVSLTGRQKEHASNNLDKGVYLVT